MPNEATNFAEALVENNAVFLNTDQFGIDVTQYPLGRQERKADWPALFTDTSLLDSSRGKEVTHTGELLIAATVECDTRDQWLVQGKIWQTLKFNDVEMGLQLVQLFRTEVDIRTAASPASKIIK